MASTVAPSPPSPAEVAALTPDQQATFDKLDREIDSIRAEIAALSKRQSLLTSTLLASSSVQYQLCRHLSSSSSSSSSEEELISLLDKHSLLARASAHRLAFGVTCFPFVDPSPDTSNTRLLGVRFDICKRNGQFDAPYYILLKRPDPTTANGAEPSITATNQWFVHRHTIPALVPLQEYANHYSLVPDQGYGSEDSMVEAGPRPVDLLGFVTAVRNDLTSWQMRKEAIQLCHDQLLDPSPDDDHHHHNNNNNNNNTDVRGSRNSLKYGVLLIEPVALDAHYARIVWRDGKVGRIKIDRDGGIETAVVFRSADNQNLRCQSVERMLLAGSGRIQDLAARLKDVAQRSAYHRSPLIT